MRSIVWQWTPLAAVLSLSCVASEGWQPIKTCPTGDQYQSVRWSFDAPVPPGVTLETGAIGRGASLRRGDSLELESSYACSIPALTVCAWVRAQPFGTDVRSNWAIIDFDRSAYFSLYISKTDGRVTFATAAAEEPHPHEMTSTASINDGYWHHVCGQYSSDSKRLYVDGARDAALSNVHNGAPLGTGVIRFGFAGATTQAAATHNFPRAGMLDELEVHHTVLTEHQIRRRALRESERSPDQLGLFQRRSSYVVLHTGETAGGRRFHFGKSAPNGGASIIPIAGDFDDDNGDSLGFFDTQTHEFQLSNHNRPGDAELRFSAQGRLTGDLRPVVGNFNGHGGDSLGVFDARTGEFCLSDTLGELALGCAQRFHFGQAGTIPFAGDFDGPTNGQRIDTVGTYDPKSGRVHLRNPHADHPGDVEFFLTPQRGYPLQSYPVVGDFDGDGIDTIALFSPATNTLYRQNPTGTPQPVKLGFKALADFENTTSGVPDVMPLVGNWTRSGIVNANAGFEWPLTTPEEADFDAAALEAIDALANTYDHVHSLMVVRDGKLVWERYYNGWSGSMGHNIKEISSSVLAAVLNKSIADNATVAPAEELDTTLNRALSSYAPNLPAHVGRHLQLRDLLRVGGDNRARRLRTKKALTSFLQHTTGRTTKDFTYQQLLQPLSIELVRWDHGTSGAELLFKSRDIARLGELFLNRGCINRYPCPREHQLLDAEWVDRITKSWRRLPSSTTYRGREIKGEGGQLIWVVPDIGTTLVITSRFVDSDHPKQLRDNRALLSRVLGTLNR